MNGSILPGRRRFSVCQFHFRCLKRAITDWSRDIFTTRILLVVLFGLLVLWYLGRLAVQEQQVTDQIVQNIAGFLAWVSVIGAWLIWKIFSAPYRMEADMHEEYRKSLSDVTARLTTLESEQSRLLSEKKSRDDLVFCANQLSELIDEGHNIMRGRSDNRESGIAWSRRVDGILQKYYPTAAADFRAVRSIFSSDEWRRALGKELGKLSEIMIRLQNVI